MSSSNLEYRRKITTYNLIDLFHEIKTAYQGGPSVFDRITKDDLIVAFFPCIYFETIQMLYYSFDNLNNRHKPKHEQIKDAIERLQNRTEFHTLLYMLAYIAVKNGLRLIIENPATKPSYLIDTQNFPKPTIIDKNRMERGDWFVKPTAYWFFNCERTYGFSHQNDKKQKIINKCKSAPHAGLCSEERSLISPDYARNFICDFVIGKEQNLEPTLFDFEEEQR